MLAQQLVEDLPRLRRTRLGAHDHVAGHDVIAVDEAQSARLQLAQRLGQRPAREASLCRVKRAGDDQEKQRAANHERPRTIRRSPSMRYVTPAAAVAASSASPTDSGTLPCSI